MSPPPLSVLDLVPVTSGSTPGQALANSVDLARRCEAAGYRRYWVAEHHLNPGVAGTTPALVIGLPVGFVGAVEAKRALRDSGLPSVTNISEKGGAAVAAAALNALVYGDPLNPQEPPS